MDLLVTDPRQQEHLIAERQASGGDRFDEVWEGTYVMAPIADNEHQSLQGRLTSILQDVVGLGSAALVLPGANISDRDDDWRSNYRCPDVALFLPGTSATDRGTYWLGGPDFAVEILSPGDRTPQKLSFYASVNVRELLVIAREPWSVELYRLEHGQLASVGRATPDDSNVLESHVLPVSYRIVSGRRPTIEVTHRDTRQRWLA